VRYVGIKTITLPKTKIIRTRWKQENIVPIVKNINRIKKENNFYEIVFFIRPVALIGRAMDSKSMGWRFESSQACAIK
jgi:hypothetical protein